jgi:NAD(P)-dependent dehydrogenase (short-subunit alcohol dehydrogenase family)
VRRRGQTRPSLAIAGISAMADGPADTIDAAFLAQVYATNVHGVVDVTNAVLPLLRRSPAGRIVNMSSTVGSLALVAQPDGPSPE